MTEKELQDMIIKIKSLPHGHFNVVGAINGSEDMVSRTDVLRILYEYQTKVHEKIVS